MAQTPTGEGEGTMVTVNHAAAQLAAVSGGDPNEIARELRSGDVDFYEGGGYVFAVVDERDPIVRLGFFRSTHHGPDEPVYVCRACRAEFAAKDDRRRYVRAADGRTLRSHRRNCSVDPVDVYEPMVCR
jgi:hypothetical protein